MSEIIEITREEIDIEVKKAYKKGYLDATTALAVYDNGIQCVGVTKRPLSKLIPVIENEYYFDEDYKS